MTEFDNKKIEDIYHQMEDVALKLNSKTHAHSFQAVGVIETPRDIAQHKIVYACCYNNCEATKVRSL